MTDKVRELSKKVQDGLRRLGYSKKRVDTRAKIYNNASEGSTYFHSNRNSYCQRLDTFDIIMTGSRREGMSDFWDSDTDRLIVPMNAMCVDTQCVSAMDCEGKSVFILNYKGAPDGYAYLKLHSLPENIKCVDIVMCDCIEKDGFNFLTNNGTLPDIVAAVLSPNKISEHGTQPTSYNKYMKMDKEKQHGPSRPFALRVPLTRYKLNYDNVLALKCSSHHLSDWCDSKCDKSWPSDETVVRIRGVDAHVVPIGVDNTEDENLQWRISHALAELELVKSFNDTQIKVYGLMKIIGKTILKEALKKLLQHSEPDTEVPSLSYIIKNVMFWLSEEETTSGFTEELFTERVMQVLRKLLVTMETGFLPSYIIPSRNICTTKLTEKYRRALVIEVKSLLLEGLEMVKRISCLQEHVDDTNTQTLEQQAKRRQIEEYFYIAPLTLPPEQMAEIKSQFLNTKWPIQALWVYLKGVWPYFLKTVTDNMFEEFSDRSDIRKFIHIVSEYIGLRNFLRCASHMTQYLVFEVTIKLIQQMESDH